MSHIIGDISSKNMIFTGQSYIGHWAGGQIVAVTDQAITQYRGVAAIAVYVRWAAGGKHNVSAGWG